MVKEEDRLKKWTFLLFSNPIFYNYAKWDKSGTSQNEEKRGSATDTSKKLYFPVQDDKYTPITLPLVSLPIQYYLRDKFIVLLPSSPNFG